MAFDALEVSLQLVAALRAPLEKFRSHDPKLADEARRALTSVALNTGEGRERIGRDRLHCFRIAAGSLSEVRTALRIAVAWGYLAPWTLRDPQHLADRLAAMRWKLARPRR
jgi:four helix bundle protein